MLPCCSQVNYYLTAWKQTCSSLLFSLCLASSPHLSAPQDEYDGVLTSEEEEDGQGNGDAVQGRLLEEGGGSDSQEDETDSEEPTDDDDGDGSESYDDGAFVCQIWRSKSSKGER